VRKTASWDLPFEGMPAWFISFPENREMYFFFRRILLFLYGVWLIKMGIRCESGAVPAAVTLAC
jgi:hypothetical protein